MKPEHAEGRELWRADIVLALRADGPTAARPNADGVPTRARRARHGLKKPTGNKQKLLDAENLERWER
jgi:hypothetical protein